MVAMEAAMQAQSQDIVGIAAGFARSDDRVFIQNPRTAAVHYARSNDDGHTVCGWNFARAGRLGAGLVYRIVNTHRPPGRHALRTKRAYWARHRHDIMFDLSGG